jgi:hypothetical protein
MPEGEPQDPLACREPGCNAGLFDVRLPIRAFGILPHYSSMCRVNACSRAREDGRSRMRVQTELFEDSGLAVEPFEDLPRFGRGAMLLFSSRNGD